MERNKIDWSEVDGLIQTAIEEDLFPGSAIHIIKKGTVLKDNVYGFAQISPLRRIATKDTLWDLASLTKILCTAPLFLKLAIDGTLPPSTKIATIINSVPPDITVADCLSHSSGLPSWKPLYATTIKQMNLWGTRLR
mgnify:CR=1 FL=1